MGSAWLRVSPSILLELCKADGLQNLRVLENRLPDDAAVIGAEVRDERWGASSTIWLLIESAEIPETDPPAEWPSVVFERVDVAG